MASVSFISFVKMGKGLFQLYVPLIPLSPCLVLKVAKPTVKDDLFGRYFCFVDYKTTCIGHTSESIWHGLDMQFCSKTFQASSCSVR